MKTIEGIKVIESANDITLNHKLSEQFYNWQSEKTSDFINESDRATRCHDAASDGCDGSYHHEVIDDFNEFGTELLSESERSIEKLLENEDITESEYDTRLTDAMARLELCRLSFDANIASLTQWHIDNGSYEKQVG